MKKILSILLLITVNNCFAQVITTVAGCHIAGYSGDGGIATAAKVNHAAHIVFTNSGEMLFTDYYNNCIRKVNALGIISKVIGTGTAGYSGDGGPASACKLNLPNGFSSDKWGNLYIADQGNNVVRKVDTLGIISTIAGNSIAGYTGDGVPATATEFNQPTGMAIDGIGNIYIADYHNSRIREIDTSGIVHTIAGTGVSGYSGDGGAATLARIYIPGTVIIDNSGALYFTDQYNHKVRKIDTFGIISTVAGTGSPGYTGDGGAATAANLYYPSEIKFDSHGNLLIDDSYNNVIRKVNSFGMISTVAGNGSAGYSGDGGVATSASLHQPWGISLDKNDNLFIGDAFNDVIRKVQFAPTFVSDSFKIFLDKYCSGPQISVITDRYSAGMYVKTNYGDGFTDSLIVLSPGYANFSHTYSNSGTYTIRQVLYISGIVIDSFKFSYAHTLCNDFAVGFYFDGNGNCVKDGSEYAVTQPVRVEVDSAGIPVDTISTTSGLYYTAYGSPGCVYAFRVLSTPAGLKATCPSTGVVYDTISVGIFSPPGKDIGMACTPLSGFNLGVYATIYSTGIYDQYGDVFVNNTTCAPPAAAVTINYSRKCKFINNPDDSKPAPDSYTDSTITWNLPPLAVNDPRSFKIFYRIWNNPAIGLLTIGDTIHTNFVATPYAGDLDTLNNSETGINTIKGGCDPNEIFVTPSCLASGANAQQLTYTIHFENTGNDTAHNIYVMDTLPDYTDISTMNSVMSSDEMYVTKVKSGGHNLIKFDFPSINLLDSSHHGSCDGALIYTIDTKPGLSIGTNIFNQAGIFFDNNPVVTTNTALTTIGCGGVLNASISQHSTIELFPNPGTNELTIKTDGSYQNYSITNIVGQQLLSETITSRRASVDVSKLPPGVYYVVLKGTGSEVVKKYVKW